MTFYQTWHAEDIAFFKAFGFCTVMLRTLVMPKHLNKKTQFKTPYLKKQHKKTTNCRCVPTFFVKQHKRLCEDRIGQGRRM